MADRRVEAAFASVKREDFLGRGSWQIDALGTRLRADHKLRPGFSVRRCARRHRARAESQAGAPCAPDRERRAPVGLVHAGAGVGYYTAILHHLVGRRGKVTAIEFDPGLAERLAGNFTGADNVRVICGDGTRVEFDRADVIYLNAGATKPADAWLDRLTDGGGSFYR